MECEIQIFLDGCWQLAATFEPYAAHLERGHEGSARLQYDVDYAVRNLGRSEARLIPDLDVGFELHRYPEG